MVETQTKTVTRGNLEITATVTTEPGRISVDAALDIPEVELQPVPSPTGPSLPAAILGATLRASPSAYTRLRNQVEGLRDNAASQLGVPVSVIRDNPNVRIQLPLEEELTLNRTIQEKDFEELPVDVNVGEVEFIPATIPNFEGVQGISNQAQNLLEQIDADPGLTFTYIHGNFIGRLLGGPTTIDFDIPLSTFVEEVQISQFGCDNMFPQIESSLNEMESSLDKAESEISDVLTPLRNISTELLSIVGVSATRPRLTDGIRKVNRSQITENVDELVDNNVTVNRVKDISVDTVINISSIQDGLDSASSRVSGMNVPSCKNEFKNRIDSIESRLSEVQSDKREAENLKDELLDILSGIEVGIACAEEIPNSLNNRISNFRVDINFFQEINPTSRSTVNKRQLLHEGEQIIETIEQSNMPEECKNQFTGRVREMIGILENLRPIIGEGCEAQFPDIYSDISNLENQAQRVTSGETGQIRSLISDAESLARRVESDVGGECADAFSTRLKGVINALEGKIQVGVRVRTEEQVRTAAEQRREQIKELRERLEAIGG